MNLFATILTYPAPTSNYRGESEENRTIIQKITEDRFEYPVISPEAMRNALREVLRGYGLPCNRKRLTNENQPAVQYKDYPWPEEYIDDFFFGYMVAKKEQIPENIIKERNFQYKRDSILRMNLAKALEPYRHDALFTQSPLAKNSSWQNVDTSVLLYREMAVSAFQYPFAINLNDCRLDKGEKYNEWLILLLKAISELNSVAGNHARSYYEMAPASILIRLSESLVAGYNTYGFERDSSFKEVTDGILHGDYPGSEFYIGGEIVRKSLNHETQGKLIEKGAHLFRMANQALDFVSRQIAGKGFIGNDKEEN